MRNPLVSVLAPLMTLSAIAQEPKGEVAPPVAPPVAALASMPVREVTIFKDGHAFVLQSGELPTDAAGNVVLDRLPAPVLGTFWPYVSGKAKLVATVAGQKRVRVSRTGLELGALLRANVGAEVFLTESTGNRYAGTITAALMRTSEELALTEPSGSGDMLPQPGNLILVRTAEGTKAVGLERIQEVTFRGDVKTTLTVEEFRNLLTLRLEWPSGARETTATVGMGYLQMGLRWIPNYHVTIDGAGKAKVRLQATVLNELTDLEDVTAHLVVGVPTFDFKSTMDPIALQKTLAELSQYFQSGDSSIASNLSNALQGQMVRMAETGRPATGQGGVDLGPEVAGRNEDLFVFTVQHLTLAKGQRMVVPVAEFELDYRDVYTLDVPFGPPPEIRRNIDENRLAELARLLAAPKVMHVLRLANKSNYPLTTAPALIERDGRILGQGTMTYTPAGAEVDLPITAAVEVKMTRSEQETDRALNAMTWQREQFARISLTGSIVLTNYKPQAVDVEVTRHVTGNVDSADHDGKTEMVNVYENLDGLAARPPWWHWYGWPSWWAQLNGTGRVRWTVKLEPGKPLTLGYQWHYFWR